MIEGETFCLLKVLWWKKRVLITMRHAASAQIIYESLILAKGESEALHPRQTPTKWSLIHLASISLLFYIEAIQCTKQDELCKITFLFNLWRWKNKI